MTAITQTYVVNLALALIGTERINDFEDDNASANIARDVWEIARLDALASHEWRFASEIANLQRGSAPDAGYTYRYQAPANFIRLNAVYSDASMSTPISDYAFRQGYVHCSSEAVYLDYVYDHDTVGAWPPWFVQYMAAVLAMHIASTQKSTSETLKFEELATKRLGAARALDSTQQPVRRPPPGRWIQAVRGNYRTI